MMMKQIEDLESGARRQEPRRDTAHSTITTTVTWLLGVALLLANGATAVAGTPVSRHILNEPRATFDHQVALHSLAGRDLTDIEILWDGTEERYSAVVMPLTGTVHTLIQEPYSAWSTFLSDMSSLDGHYLDIEVNYFGVVKLYSAIFLEDGNDHTNPIYSTNSDAAFQSHLETQFKAGRSIIDFEAYEDGAGNLQYAGLWSGHPNQPITSLLYGLKSAELNDILDPAMGRVLDIEQYPGPQGVGTRYAVILAQATGDRPEVRRGYSEANIGSVHNSVGDADTHLIDIDFFQSAGTYYNAVWGSAPKGLAQVPSMPPEVDPQPISAALQGMIDDFESSNGQSGEIGIYAKNLRSGQSISYRADKIQYLASSTKTAMHIKLYQKFEAGLDPNTMTPYTLSALTKEQWYVDERDTSWGPFGDFPGLGDTDFGDSFALERYDRAMMQVSDNGTTSLLTDHPTYGVAHDPVNLNEWLAGLPGIGRELGLFTSIQDVDRFVLWQGQQDPSLGFLHQPSYFSVPTWASSPWLRFQTDPLGELAALFPLGQPGYDKPTGRARTKILNFNSGSPRAVSRLLEGLWQGEYLDAANTQAALNVMLKSNPIGGDWTPLDNHASFPSAISVYAKGGTKWNSRSISDTGILEMGPDAISVVLLSSENTRSRGCSGGDETRCHFADIAHQLLVELSTDLFVTDGSVSFSPGTVSAGEGFQAECDVFNLLGGDAQAFEVGFYASPDTAIATSDHLIGTASIPSLEGIDSVTAEIDGSFPPSVPAGDYHVGCIVDPTAPGDDWGSVGEYDESIQSNATTGTAAVLTVEASTSLIFTDGFESGDTAAWSASLP